MSGQSISQRAVAASNPPGVKDMPEAEKAQHLDEQYRLLSKEWAQADGHAFYLAELKTTMLAQLVTKYMAENGQVALNQAERIIKSGEEWGRFLVAMRDARIKANELKEELTSMRMRERRMDNSNWEGRHLRTMARSSP